MPNARFRSFYFFCWTVVLALGPGLVHCGSDNGGQPSPDASAMDGGGEAAVMPDAPTLEASSDAGVPAASFAASAIDFGFVDCGGAAPGTRTLAIQNTGTGDLHWSAQLDSSTVFSIMGPASGVLAPGAASSLALASRAIVPSTPAGTGQSATLTLTTDDPARASTAITVKQTAAGATLALTPSMGAAFGVVPVGTQASDIPLTLKNTGNEPLTLSFKAPVDPQFQIVWTGAPGTVTVAPGGSVPGLVARYKPTAQGSDLSSSPFVLSGALCANTLQAIPLSGQGSAGGFGESPGAIDFGQVSCGATSTLPVVSRTITITNGGNAAFTWAAVLGRGTSSAFTLATTNTTVSPNGAPGSIVVSPKAIPATSAVTDNLYGDSITITTNIPQDPPHTVPLTETASGAIVAFVPSLPVSFGGVPIDSATTAPFSVVNSGNAAATVTLAASHGPVFTLSQPDVGPLASGDTAFETATFAPTSATAGQSSSVSVSLGVTDVSCGPLPTLSLSGDGTNGSASVAPSALDFGLVDCGKRATAKTITVTNAGSTAFNLTGAALTLGANYTVTPAAFPVAVGPMSSVMVTVTPSAIPAASGTTPDLYADTLTITTNAANDPGHVIPLHMTGHGAILLASTGSVAFGGVPINTTASSQLTITNDGNASAAVSFTNAAAPFAIAPQGATVVGNAAQIVIASFSPTLTQGYTDAAQLSVPAGTPLCAPLPTSIGLSGTGTSGLAVVTPSSLDYGRVSCGSSAQERSISIQNKGSAPFTWQAVLSSNATAFYQLSAASGSVDPGNAGTLLVTPSAIPSQSLTTDDLYAGTVTITTSGAVGDAPHVVGLHETAFGARLSLDVSLLAFPDTSLGTSSSLPLSITNSGNGTANLTYTGYQAPSLVAAPDLVPINGGTNLNVTMTFTPQATGPLAGQTYAITTPDVLCLPLPAAIPVTGSGM